MDIPVTPEKEAPFILSVSPEHNWPELRAVISGIGTNLLFVIPLASLVLPLSPVLKEEKTDTPT